jgi:hypothetical protein
MPLFVSVIMVGWSGCSARSPEVTSEAKTVEEHVAQPVSPPVSEPVDLETFSVFLDRA